MLAGLPRLSPAESQDLQSLKGSLTAASVCEWLTSPSPGGRQHDKHGLAGDRSPRALHMRGRATGERSWAGVQVACQQLDGHVPVRQAFLQSIASEHRSEELFKCYKAEFATLARIIVDRFAGRTRSIQCRAQ